MPPVLCLLVSNLPIAALWEGNWQRALILQTDFVQQMCDVMFVDCGVCTRVAAKNVRFLPSRFVKLPFQNLHCRIANVIPAVGNNWSADTTMQFCMLTIGNLLRAKVVKIDVSHLMFICYKSYILILFLKGEFAPRRGYILPNGSLSVELFFVNANDEPQSVGESLVTSGFAAKVRISCPPPPGFCGPTEFEMNNELAVIADELDHIAVREALKLIVSVFVYWSVLFTAARRN